jgi:hypothetical protein
MFVALKEDHEKPNKLRQNDARQVVWRSLRWC